MPEHNPGDMGGTMRLGKRQTVFKTENSILSKFKLPKDFRLFLLLDGELTGGNVSPPHVKVLPLFFLTRMLPLSQNWRAPRQKL